MINNPDLKVRLTDSIAASSRSMDTTNFYADIYPLLQKVKARGIKVLVFGGDKAKINISYSPEDSITFYTARMATDFPDSINNVIVMDYSELNKTITCNYVTLSNIEKNSSDSPSSSSSVFKQEQTLKIWPSGSKEVTIQLQTTSDNKAIVQIFTINGAIKQSIYCNSNEYKTILFTKPGIYVAKTTIGNSILAKKFVIQ
jgi:hypothetical protein